MFLLFLSRYLPQHLFSLFLQAFFNDKYMQEHPEDLEKIEKLKDLIAWQVRPKLVMHTIVLMHHAVVCKALVYRRSGKSAMSMRGYHKEDISSYSMV